MSLKGSDGDLYGVTRDGSDAGGNHSGLVFKVTPGGNYTALYRFPFALTSNGSYPEGELVEGSPGTFYGTTESRFLGTQPGTVFRVTSVGAYSKLRDLAGNSSAGLVLGSDGNFYGTTSNVPPVALSGTVFRVTPTGTYTTLHTFSGADGARPLAPVVLGDDGNFYGTTYSGGQFGAGTVFRITPGGVLTTLHSFNPSLEGHAPNALTLASDGNFYGTTSRGSAGGVGTALGTIFRITPGGNLTTLHSFNILGDGGNEPLGGLVETSDGTFYGTTSKGGMFGVCPGGCGTVFKFSLPAGATTPSAPTGLVASVSGSTVALTWTASPGATSYRLRAGAIAGASNIFNGNIGNRTTLSAGVSAGTYYVRVHAVGPGGESGPSNEVTIVVGGCAVPAGPTGLQAAVAGRTVTLSWNAAAGTTSYVIEAGSAPGAANLANFATGTSVTSFTAGNVAPGAYFVRVRAQNACATSVVSNEATINVGG